MLNLLRICLVWTMAKFGAATLAVTQYERPCGQGSYLNATLNSLVVYKELNTRSVLECAQMCSFENTCYGFNVCSLPLKYRCELMDTFTTDISCAMLDVHSNCSFEYKSSYINALAYLENSEESLLAKGCPSDSYLLPEYHICYWIVQSSTSNVNMTACDGTGGYLAVLPSDNVMNKLKQKMEADSSVQSNKYYWIDVNDMTDEDDYVNRFGPITWTAWDSRQPNDNREVEDQDCTIMSPRYNYEWHDRNCENVNGYYPLCFNYVEGDGFRRRYTIQANSNNTYGNVTELISDIDRGMDVRILIQGYSGDFDILLNADAIFDYGTVGERCAQSVHNTNVDQDTGTVARLIINTCTTGTLRIETWKNGARTVSIFTPTIIWFTSDRSTTTLGLIPGFVDPNFDFRNYSWNGNDIFAQTDLARFPLHHVYYGGSILGQFSWVADTTDWKSVFFDKDGGTINVNWPSDDDNDDDYSFNEQSSSFDLHITESWKLVYSNYENGTTAEGRIIDLINYINAGHEVKIDIGGKIAKADVVCLKSLQIYVIFSLEFRSSDFTKNLRRLVAIASTTGQITNYLFGFKTDSILSETKSQSAIRWFVDTSVWTEVYRTNSYHSSNDGVVTLSEVYNAGQPTRIKISTSTFGIFFTTDGVKYHATTSEFQATFSRGFDIALSSGSVVMSTPVQSLIFEISSQGSYTKTTVPNGMSVYNQTQTVTNNPISWFSNPYIF